MGGVRRMDTTMKETIGYDMLQEFSQVENTCGKLDTSEKHLRQIGTITGVANAVPWHPRCKRGRVVRPDNAIK